MSRECRSSRRTSGARRVGAGISGLEIAIGTVIAPELGCRLALSRSELRRGRLVLGHGSHYGRVLNDSENYGGFLRVCFVALSHF